MGVRPHFDKSYKPKLLNVPTIVAPKLAHVMDGLDRILPEDAPVRFPLKSIAPAFGLRYIAQDVLVPLAHRKIFDPGICPSSSSFPFGLSVAALELSSGEVPKIFSPSKVFDPGRSSRGIVAVPKLFPPSSLPSSFPSSYKSSPKSGLSALVEPWSTLPVKWFCLASFLPMLG